MNIPANIKEAIKNRSVRHKKFFDIVEYHIVHNIGISRSPMRLGSETFEEYTAVIRELYERGLYEPVNAEDTFLLEKLQTGKKGVYQGKEVVLDTPFKLRGEKKEFGVYRPSKTGAKDEQGRVKAVVVKWGDPELEVKNDDKDKADNFWARHKCSTKKDKYSSGWWACYAPELFGDLLGLAGGKSRW